MVKPPLPKGMVRMGADTNLLFNSWKLCSHFLVHSNSSESKAWLSEKIPQQTSCNIQSLKATNLCHIVQSIPFYYCFHFVRVNRNLIFSFAYNFFSSNSCSTSLKWFSRSSTHLDYVEISTIKTTTNLSKKGLNSLFIKSIKAIDALV